jgi:hypothetical protein
VLEFKQPVGVVERLTRYTGQHWADDRQ